MANREAEIVASDKDGFCSMSFTARYNDDQELLAQWQEFKSKIPYARYFTEVVAAEAAEEKRIQDLLS